MAEATSQERTLPASQRRLDKAREEGQVARSTELATLMLLGSAAAAFWWSGEAFVRSFKLLLGMGLRVSARDAFDTHEMFNRLASLSIEGLLAAAPLLGALALAALAAPLLLGGWVFSTKAFQFDVERFKPLTTLGRMFSTHGLAELGKALAKALLLTAILAGLLWKFVEPSARLAAMSAPAALEETAHMLLLAFLALIGACALIAAIDVPLQWWRHHSALRMTLEEAREENRESEGDPQLKSRVRSLQREMARRRMMTEVPKADVVITNPTHYAVALAYHEDRMGAPRVLAKGVGLVAQRIRELAGENNVPLVEAPPLARALYRHAEIGDEVPAALYNAVAQVLAYVFRLKRSLASGSPRPELPREIEVPAELDPGVFAS
jgi:flagellar biosynthetic protein FlhB